MNLTKFEGGLPANVSLRVTDDIGIVNGTVEFKIENYSSTTNLTLLNGTSYDGYWYANIDVPPVLGNASLKVNFENGYSVYMKNFTIVVTDTTAPEIINLTYPASVSGWTGCGSAGIENITITLSAKDNLKIKQVKLYSNAGGNITINFSEQYVNHSFNITPKTTYYDISFYIIISDGINELRTTSYVIETQIAIVDCFPPPDLSWLILLFCTFGLIILVILIIGLIKLKRLKEWK